MTRWDAFNKMVIKEYWDNATEADKKEAYEKAKSTYEFEKAWTDKYSYMDKRNWEYRMHKRNMDEKAQMMQMWDEWEGETKIDVSDWFTLEESNVLEDQVKAYIANTVEGYLNGVQWDASMYTPMTLEEWKRYVTDNLDRDIKDGMVVNGTEYKHFRFLGKKRFNELVDVYLKNYEDVQAYIASPEEPYTGSYREGQIVEHHGHECRVTKTWRADGKNGISIIPTGNYGFEIDIYDEQL